MLYFVACLVELVIHLSWCDFLKADKAHKILSQAAEFLWIFLWIYSVNKEKMDDDFKPASMITNLCYYSSFLNMFQLSSQVYTPHIICTYVKAIINRTC